MMFVSRYGCWLVGLALAAPRVAEAQPAPPPVESAEEQAPQPPVEPTVQDEPSVPSTPTESPDAETDEAEPISEPLIPEPMAVPPPIPRAVLSPTMAPYWPPPPLPSRRIVPDSFSVGYGFTMLTLGAVLGVSGGLVASQGASRQQCAITGCFDEPNHQAEHVGGALLGAGVGLAASGVAAVVVGWDGYEAPAGMRRNDAAVTAGMMLTSLGGATLGSGVGMLIADGSRGDVFRGRTVGPLMVIGGVSAAVGIPLWLTSSTDLEPDRSDRRPWTAGREAEDRSTSVGVTGVVFASLGAAGAAVSASAGASVGGLGGGFLTVIGAGAGGGLAAASVPLIVMGFKDAPVGYEVRSQAAMGLGLTLLTLGTPAVVAGAIFSSEVLAGRHHEPPAGTGLLIGGLTGLAAGLPLTIWGSWLVPEGQADGWVPALEIGPGSGKITMSF